MEEQQVSFVQRLRELTAADPDAAVYTHVALAGPERVLTTAELDRRSSQLAGAMATKGLGPGDRLALGLPQLARARDGRLRGLEARRHPDPGPLGPPGLGARTSCGR